MIPLDHMIDLAISLPIAFAGMWLAIILLNAIIDAFSEK